MYDILSLERKSVVYELLKSNPEALKTNHEMRLCVKAPLPNLNEEPLYGVVCACLLTSAEILDGFEGLCYRECD